MKSALLNLIPDDLLEFYIWPHLPILTKVWLNKELYLKYHSHIQKYIKMSANYIRDIIRNDYSFVFNRLMEENLDCWIIPNKHYVYNNITFKDYLNYIHYLISKHNSDKCKMILYSKLKNSGLEKKWHKYKSRKNIQWII